MSSFPEPNGFYRFSSDLQSAVVLKILSVLSEAEGKRTRPARILGAGLKVHFHAGVALKIRRPE